MTWHTNRLGFAVALVLAPAQAAAQGTSPIQIALVTPVQIVPATRAVAGVRLDLLYGRNTYVKGLDIGLVNHSTQGVSQGLQYGLVNIVNGDFQGWEDGAVNVTEGHFEGFQSGGVNVLGDGGGFQWGIVNHAQRLSGLQLGIVNYAARLHGLQIGLVNIIAHGGALPVLPIVNWSF